MRAGQLRQVLALQQRAIGTDAERRPTEGWNTIGTLRARVEPLGGQELTMAAQLELKLTHQVETRWRPDLARANSAAGTSGHNMRLLWGVRILDVQLVQDPDGRRRALHLLCLEHQD
jgi:SPP1 family predicted phage head-tail adaptor